LLLINGEVGQSGAFEVVRAELIGSAPYYYNSAMRLSSRLR